MYDNKKIYRYGSTEESIAIYVINRQRTARLLETLLCMADPPKDIDKLFKQYKGVLFPEDKYDMLTHLKKMQDAMKKLRGITVGVMPVRTIKRKGQ